MLSLKHVGVAAGLALAANAFMIPSTMSMPDAKGDGIDALKAFDPSRIADSSNGGGRLTKLPCLACKLPGGLDVDMSLILNWTITDEGKTLLLNDAPFLGSNDVSPQSNYNFLQMPSALPDFLTSFLSSHGQVYYQHGPQDSEPHVLEPLALGVHTTIRQITATDDTDAQLIDVDFHIDDAKAGNPSEMESVSLRIIKDEQDVFQILEIDRVPADGSAAEDAEPQKSVTEEEQMFEILPISPIAPASPNGESATPAEIPAIRHKTQIVNCHGLPLSVCRFHYMLKTRIQAMHKAIMNAISNSPSRGSHRVPCGKGRPHGPAGVNIKGGVNKFTNPDGTPKVHPHHAHKYHSVFFRTLHVLRRFFFGFVVPVLIGVAAGMTASLAGMLVGTLLAMLWFRIRRGGKRGQQGNVRLESGDAEESEGLMKEAEAAAEHRDSVDTLPAYEEKQSQTDA